MLGARRARARVPLRKVRVVKALLELCPSRTHVRTPGAAWSGGGGSGGGEGGGWIATEGLFGLEMFEQGSSPSEAQL